MNTQRGTKERNKRRKKVSGNRRRFVFHCSHTVCVQEQFHFKTKSSANKQTETKNC